MRKEHYTILWLTAGCIALNFLNSPLSEMFSDDKEIFKYVGLVIFKGGSPYRDVFDHKPPLIYFLDALGWFVSAWLPWVLDTLLVLVATLLLYWLSKKNKMPWPWFLPVLFNLLLRYSLVSYGNGMTREYTTVFLLMFFCVMQGNAKYKYHILGLLTALTLWMQQDAFITLAPFIFYSLFFPREPVPTALGKKILSYAIGVLLISVPLIFYFAMHHSLYELWKDAIIFNLHPPGYQPNLWEKIKVIKHAIHEVEFEMPFYTALILGVVSLFLKNRNPALLYAAVLALILSFAGEYLSGRLKSGNAFTYYLLPLAATIPIIVWVVFINTQVAFFQDKTVSFIFYMMLCTVVFIGTLRFASVYHINKDTDKPFDGLPETKYLDGQSLTDYQLFIFGDSNLTFFYNKYGILAPTPWIYQYFWDWSIDWDKDKRIFHSIVSDLQRHRTKFILDCSVARKDIKNNDIVEEWQKFLQSNYKPVLSDSLNRRLWRIQ